MFQAIWNYRGFVIGLVVREFQSRYLRSLLGSLWLILQPLVTIFVYTIIFSQVLSAKLPGVQDTWAYGIYLCAGILPWGYFTEIVTRTQTMFIERGDLMKKVYFPRSVLPFSLLLTATLNFAIIFSIFLLFLMLTNRWPGSVLIGVFPLLILQGAFALGLGVLLGSMNVFFRDIGQFVGVIMQFWFWLTPIVYPHTVVPEWLQPYLAWNPLFPVISGYQEIFVNHAWPSWGPLAWVAVVSLGLLALGWRVFRSLSGEMVDEL